MIPKAELETVSDRDMVEDGYTSRFTPSGLEDFSFEDDENSQSTSCSYSSNEHKQKHIMLRSRIKCPQCHKKTSWGVYMDSDVPSHTDDELKVFMFECYHCVGYYAICWTCFKENVSFDCKRDVTLTRLRSHRGCDQESIQEWVKHIIKTRRDAQPKIMVEVCTETTQDGDDEFEQRLIFHKPCYFYSEATFGPITGPDGGYDSVWECEQCDRLYTICDT